MKRPPIKFLLGILIITSIVSVAAMAQTSATASASTDSSNSPPAHVAPKAPKNKSGYRYAWNNCEYSLELPEAPQSKSLWVDDDLSDFEKASSLGIVGERATYNRMEWQTNDFLNVEITCINVTPEFLKSLKAQKMFDYLESQFRDVTIENKKKNFSPGAQTLSWATIEGYEFDQDKRMIYNIGHYLTGLKTVMIIKIQFVADNPTFTKQYNVIDQSIALNKN